MTSVCSGRSELTQFVANHILGYEYRYMPPAIVHPDGEADHLRNNGRRSRPGLDASLGLGSTQCLDFSQQFGVNKRAFLDRP